MGVTRRLTSNLTADDLLEHPVWEYVGDASEISVQPIDDLPVCRLRGRLVGTKIRLHNGLWLWAILSNVSLQDPKVTKHFLSVWVHKEGVWFELARYHDVDYEKRSPLRLAKFLGLHVSDVFPLEYDITDIAVGNQAALKGTIPEIPQERLTEEELIELALE